MEESGESGNQFVEENVKQRAKGIPRSERGHVRSSLYKLEADCYHLAEIVTDMMLF